MNLDHDENLFSENISHTFDLKTTSIKDIPELNTMTSG
jgi:hypothetical protein